MRFEAFTAVTTKNVFFWDVALCRSRWFTLGDFFHPEDGGDMFFRNVG
jgi:hypothetical protein